VSSGQCAYIKRLSQVINIIKWNLAGSAYVLVCDKSLTLNDVKVMVLLLYFNGSLCAYSPVVVL
jgi:hypothetical protein